MVKPGPDHAEPFGPTIIRRQLVGAIVVMAGALPVALLASSRYGRPPRMSNVLLLIGIVGIVGWLLDGRRYVGAASAAVAVGGGISIAREAFVDEYALVFGLLAVALVCVLRVNPRAVNGCAGLLLYVAGIAGLGHPGQLPRPLVFALVMLAWGGLPLWRTFTTKPVGPSADPLVLG